MAAFVGPFCGICGQPAARENETRPWWHGKTPLFARKPPHVPRTYAGPVLRCSVDPSEARNGRAVSRRDVLFGLCVAAASSLPLFGVPPRLNAEEASASSSTGVAAPAAQNGGASSSTVQPGIVVLPNGLRFTDFVQGDGAQPTWGDLVLIEYQTYVVKNGKDLQLLDTTEGRDPYFFHHGNGFQMQGMEEAVHTMQVGGFRRVIIPPHMSYVSSDLGPLPETARQRTRMNQALNEAQGLIVMDLRLLQVQATEDPRGYYSDITDRAAIKKLLSQ
ncbi:Peptidyl-prolyl cis-trans isomerase FKBP16-1, chloroplastic [Porphyridium purpureum]|uniref:peptidylprolyl isomerase n=1 Tax=Porphyridium purpureum TaxID=35688 RepID=A0A5J4Z5A1_PORPP|nr:Peptidyl-prolyl cis-trans isomerase FKBP16-1, chloroplastic [Porphyridium purpureum]|eukprot:POR5886..scf295_1